MHISDYMDPVKTDVRGLLASKLRNMPVGMAVLVSGETVKKVAAKVYGMKATDPEKKFSVSDLKDGKVQILRKK